MKLYTFTIKILYLFYLSEEYKKQYIESTSNRGTEVKFAHLKVGVSIKTKT